MFSRFDLLTEMEGVPDILYAEWTGRFTTEVSDVWRKQASPRNSGKMQTDPRQVHRDSSAESERRSRHILRMGEWMVQTSMF